jgi:hypothetical protein
MKKILTLKIYLIFFQAFGQVTPNCTDISQFIVVVPPLTQAQINSINSQQQSQFPNVTKLEEPTTSYNCHNYAFVKHDGGDEFWLNSPGDDQFWIDGSYISSFNTGESELRVSYQGDHSAVTTSNNNQAISKWGAWGLYRHNLYDVPAVYMPNSPLSFFVKSLTISGSVYLCSSSTYSIQNPPAGSTISWSVFPTHLFSGATSGSGATANLSPASSAASGQAILTFEVTTTCGVISVDKRIWVGNATVNDITFSNSVDEFQHWCSSDDGNTFSINSLLDPDNTQWEARLLNWPSLTVAYTSPSVYTGAGPHQWFYVPPFPTQNNGYYVFQVRNINGCSPSNWIPGFEVEYVDCTIFGGDPFRVFPNPTTDYVTVSKISHQKLGEEIQRDQTSFEVSLFDVLGQEIISRTAATDEATLDLSKLKKGRYYIHIYYKEAIIRKQIKVE